MKDEDRWLVAEKEMFSAYRDERCGDGTLQRFSRTSYERY